MKDTFHTEFPATGTTINFGTFDRPNLQTLTHTTIGHEGRSITYHGAQGATLLTRKGEQVTVYRGDPGAVVALSHFSTSSSKAAA